MSFPLKSRIPWDPGPLEPLERIEGQVGILS